MADINKFSEQVIDFAERLANVADAAKGKDTKTMRPKVRWVLLPAAGAGIYALTSRAFTRKAKTVVDEAKARASDLPDELVSRVHEAPGSGSGRSNRSKSTRTSGRSGGQRRRKTSASR
jgi:O-acetyl-ADP-ribose deacetylase (regulator of RNase III)